MLVNNFDDPPKLIMINLGNSSNKQLWDFLIKRIYETVTS